MKILTLTAAVVSITCTASKLVEKNLHGRRQIDNYSYVFFTAASVNVAHNTTTKLLCRGRMSYPIWYMGEKVIGYPQYMADHEPSTGWFLGVLVIDGNKTGGTLDLSCVVERQTTYTTRLTIEGL